MRPCAERQRAVGSERCAVCHGGDMAAWPADLRVRESPRLDGGGHVR